MGQIETWMEKSQQKKVYFERSNDSHGIKW